MTQPRLRTVLIGLGGIGVAHAKDPLTARHFAYATHAQVLRDHDRFEWVGAADSNAETLRAFAGTADAPDTVTADVRELAALNPDVAVIATPPVDRLALVKALPRVRAVILEKPLGSDLGEAAGLINYCEASNVAIQVNFWRRGDDAMRELASGGLAARTGPVSAAFALYGNGLRNNGIHMIDLLRLLLGDIQQVHALPDALGAFTAGDHDADQAFTAVFASGLRCTVETLDFTDYREVYLDLWGEQGRLSIMQEGLAIAFAGKTGHRALSGECEVASDRPERLPAAAGRAMFELYGNLARHLDAGEVLWSPGRSALDAEAVVEAVLLSARRRGEWVSPADLMAGPADGLTGPARENRGSLPG